MTREVRDVKVEQPANPTPCPPEPLPPPLRGTDEGSFAQATVKYRLARIVLQVIEDNTFPADIEAALQALAQELPDGEVRYLQDDGGPDVQDWAGYLQPYLGQTWLEIPWYLAEAYLYRRILEATRYFTPGPTYGHDPFAAQKWKGLQLALASIRRLSGTINQQVQGNPVFDREVFVALMHAALWGNRMDLSMWEVDALGEEGSQLPTQTEQANILVDEAPRVAERVASLRQVRMDVIMDNAGLELFGDLCLVDYLLACGVAHPVWLHVKAHPTFVSDVMAKDVQATLDTWSVDPDAEVRALASRLQGYLEAGRLRLREDFFWTSPLAFWEMPSALQTELAQATLVFIKGDANYRRLLGDRHWPFTMPFARIVCYFPAPCVALRTLKAEVAAGLQPGQPEALSQKDPDWLVNGRWGVIQFAEGRGDRRTAG